MITFWGNETYATEFPAGWIMTEWFDDPVVLDLSSYPTAPEGVETMVNLTVGEDDDSVPLPLDIAFSVVDDAEALEVPLGTLDGTLHMTITLSNEFIGGAGHPEAAMDFELWVHPEHFIVAMNGSTMFTTIELAEPWE